MTLTQFEAAYRLRTRHPDVDDPRALSADIKALGNIAYKRVRMRLREIAPQLYQQRTDEILVDMDNDLDFTPIGGDFDALALIERKNTLGKWDPIDRANETDPRQHQLGGVTYYRQGGRLMFQDECGELMTPITVRLTYWVVPNDITDPTGLFQVPASLERPLVLYACADQFDTDGDPTEAKACEDKAEALIKEAAPALKKQYGAQPQRSGLNRSVNWDRFGGRR
jgi:hypothetical protein